MSDGWFEDLWEKNYEFFNQAALNAATPESQLDKLAEELAELREDYSVEEAADVLVCLIGFCIKSDISVWEFLEALEAKTDVNLARTWKLQPNGTYQHMKPSPLYLNVPLIENQSHFEVGAEIDCWESHD